MMKNRYIFILLLIVCAGSICFAQRKKPIKPKSGEPVWNIAELSFDLSNNPLKITDKTVQLPKEFYGHNYIDLFKNLEREINLLRKDSAPEEKYRLLKNKKLLGSLTTDDYFIFKVQRNSGIHGYSKDLSRHFEAVTFQLRPEQRIEALTDWIGMSCIGTGRGTASPTGESPDDFLKPIKNDLIWEKSYLLLNTVKPIYSKRNYKGKKDENSDIPEECLGKTIVPSPQAQYELAFTKPQPFELTESNTTDFSFEDYDYRPVNGIGIVSWLEKGDKLPITADDYAETYFVVKLTPPYIKNEVLKTKDRIENKEFKMFSRKLFVNIESLWIVSNKTGKIVKKIEKIR